MSVQGYPLDKPTMWRVRWREPGGKMRSKSYPTKAQAEREDARIKAQKLLGHTPQRVRRARTLGQAWEEWWQLEAPEKAEATRRSYRGLWRASIEPLLGGVLLSDLVADPSLFNELRKSMNARGVGKQSHRRTLVILVMLLNHCVSWKWIDENPARGIPKPRIEPGEGPRPFSPLVVERIRAEIGASSPSSRGVQSSLLVSVMSYGGLRPQEVLALTWGDIGQTVIEVRRAASFGRVGRSGVTSVA